MTHASYSNARIVELLPGNELAHPCGVRSLTGKSVPDWEVQTFGHLNAGASQDLC
jgi:hypothetical protein